jgi:hypothetical protein
LSPVEADAQIAPAAAAKHHHEDQQDRHHDDHSRRPNEQGLIHHRAHDDRRGQVCEYRIHSRVSFHKTAAER